MKQDTTFRKRLISLVIFAALFLTNMSPFIVEAQAQTPLTKPQQKQLADQIQSRTRIAGQFDNGIFVDTPKVYDDSSLQLMLNAARARLAAIQTLDQAGLLSRIGAVTGASVSQSGFSAQVLGPPIPSIATTALGQLALPTSSQPRPGSPQL